MPSVPVKCNIAAFDVVGVDVVDDNIGDCGVMMWMLMIMRAGAAATSIWLF